MGIRTVHQIDHRMARLQALMKRLRTERCVAVLRAKHQDLKPNHGREGYGRWPHTKQMTPTRTAVGTGGAQLPVTPSPPLERATVLLDVTPQLFLGSYYSVVMVAWADGALPGRLVTDVTVVLKTIESDQTSRRKGQDHIDD